MLRAIFVVFLFCFGTAASALEHKPVLRALIACDLISYNLRGGTRADAIRMRQNISAIARLLGISSKITTLHKGQMTVPRIRKWIASLPKNGNDIAFFYYSGHGGRTGRSQGRWPFIVCPKKPPSKRPVVFMGKTICRQILRKKPRLAVVLFDSCNNQIRMKGPLDELPSNFFDVDETELPQLKKLFLESRGAVIASASSPGEKAFTLVQGPFSGGIFTTSVLFSLKYYTPGADVSWNTLFLGSNLLCQRIFHGEQNPQCSIRLSRKA